MSARHLHAVGADETPEPPRPVAPPRSRRQHPTHDAGGQAIRRTVTFQARCRRLGCAWDGEPREYKGDAAYDLARHNTDRHGGTEREGARDD